MARREYAGAAEPLTLTATILAGTLSFTVTGDVTDWPTGATNKFCIELDRGVAGKAEKMWARRSGSTISLDGSGDRGADDTTAVGHTAGATVEHVLDSESMDEANALANDTSLDRLTQYLNTTRHDVTARHLLGTSVPTGVPGTAALGDSPSEGVATSAARSDHRHGQPSLGLVGDVSAEAIGDTASAGTSPKPAHADHRHAMPGAAAAGASAPGDTASAGAAATVARSDHRHSRESAPGLVRATTSNDSDQGNTPGSTLTVASDAVAPTGTRIVFVHFTCDVRSTGAGLNFAGDAILVIDGVATAFTDRFHSHGINTVCKIALFGSQVLSAGAHTITVTMSVDPASDTPVYYGLRRYSSHMVGG